MSSSDYAISSAPTDLSWNDVALSSTGQYIYASAGDSFVYASTDFGSTWTNMTNGADQQTSGWVVCSSTGQQVSVLGSESYVYSSADFGLTWTASERDFPGTTDMASDSTGQFLVLVGGPYFYRSTDYGQTFTEVRMQVNCCTTFITVFSFILQTEFSAISNCRAVASSGSGQYITMVCGTNGNGDVVYTSQNSGSTFANVAVLENYEFSTVTMTSSGQVQLVGSDFLGGVWISKDFGSTWTTTAASSFLAYEGIATFGSGTDIALVSMASVQKSTNYGSYYSLYSMYPVLPNAVGLSSNGKVMAVVGSNQGIYITTSMFSSGGGSSSSSSSGSSGLSAGGAAGVSIAVIAVVLAAVGFVLYKMGYCAAKSAEASKEMPMGAKSAV